MNKMSKEDKELVFRDLSARLPYGVRVKVWLKEGDTEEGVLDLAHNYGDVLLDAFYLNKIVDIKPYLRHRSDMTEEEKKTYRTLQDVVCSYNYEFGDIVDDYVCVDNYASLDYLNSIHVDYRDMIEKGLAYRAPKGMYDTK